MRYIVSLGLALAPWAMAVDLVVRVGDPAGNAIRGASVQLRNVVNTTGLAEEARTTGERGAVLFAGIASGRYWVDASSEGFQSRRDSSAPQNYEMRLSVAQLSQSVVVSAARREEFLESPAPTVLIDRQAIEVSKSHRQRCTVRMPWEE